MEMKRDIGKRVLAVLCMTALLASNLSASVLASSYGLPAGGSDLSEAENTGNSFDNAYQSVDGSVIDAEDEAFTAEPDDEAVYDEYDDFYTEDGLGEADEFFYEEEDLPEELLGDSGPAGVRLVVSKVEIGTDAEEEIAFGPLVLKDEAVVLTCRADSDQPISDVQFTWISQRGTVNVEPVPETSETYDMVLITPVGDVSGMDRLDILAQFVDSDGITERNESTWLDVEVWNERNISASVSAESSGESDRVEVGDTLAASICEDGISLGESDLGSFGFQWQILEDTESGEAEFFSIDGETGAEFVPENRGVYRLCVTADDDAGNCKVGGTWFTENVEVLPAAVSVGLPEKEKTYDGSSAFLYEAEMTVTREATGEEIGPEGISATLELESSDAGVYTGILERDDDMTSYRYDIYSSTAGEGGERVKYGTLSLAMDPAAYEISSVSDITVEIRPAELAVELRAPDKYFDNTTDLPGIPEVIWGDNEVSGEKELVICRDGQESPISADDFVYTDKGDVDADTEVSIVPADEEAELRVSVDGKMSGNYVLKVTYADSTVKKCSMDAEDTVRTSGGFEKGEGNEKIRWYGADETGIVKAELTALEGFRVSSELDGPYGEKAKTVIDDAGSSSVFVRNSSNEIARVTVEELHVDRTAPAVTMEGAKALILDKDSVKVTYSISDEESGVKSIYYYVSEKDDGSAVTYDPEKWTEAEKVNVDQGKYSFDMKVSKSGYVYIRAVDNVGNSAVSRQHMLVVETDAPEKAEFTFETDSQKPLVEQKVHVSVSDNQKNGTASGIQSVQYKLTEKGSNKDVTGEAKINVKIDDDMEESDNHTISRKNAPSSEEELPEALSMDVDFTIDANGKLNGTYVLTITARDYCGNTGSYVTEMVLDGLAPKASITKKNAAGAYEGQYYYNAGNTGFAVVIEDANIAEGTDCTVAVTSGASPKTIKKTQADAKISGKKGTIEFTADEVAELDDGVITITVTAKDLAGNKIDTLEAAREKGSKSDGILVKGNTAEFVLDTRNPEITDVVTQIANGGSCSLDEANGIVTYSAAFDTKVTVKDENIGTETLSVKPGDAKEASGGKTSSGSDSGIKTDGQVSGSDNEGMKTVVITYSVTKTGLYDAFEITGTDYAGNALVLKQNPENDKNDKWSAKTDAAGKEIGGVADYKKEYSDSSVGAEITYYKQIKNNSKVTEELLDKRHRREVPDGSGTEIRGYYNSTAVIQAVFTGLSERALPNISVGMGLDGKEPSYVKLSGLSPKASENGFTLKKDDKKTDTYVLRYLCKEDGEYRIFIKGDNLSGTPITVAEKDVSGIEESYFSDSDITSEKPYGAHEVIIKDTEPPKLSEVVISSDKSTNKEINEKYGERYYFNSDYKATFTIKEKYLDEDAATIAIYRAYKDDAANTSDVIFENQTPFMGDAGFKVKHIVPDTESGNVFDPGKSQVTLTDPIDRSEDVSLEGVYDYLIYGEDLAGNALGRISGANGRMHNIRKDIEVEDTKIPYKGMGFLTNPVVIARKAPVPKIQISEKQGGKPFYVQTGSAVNEPVQYVPYSAASISVMAVTGDNSDTASVSATTPYQVSYVVKTKNGTKNVNVPEEERDFSLEPLSRDFKGRQIFSVSDVTIVDLAGNVSKKVNETYKIYLDQDIASGDDKLAPSIAVWPSHSINTDKYGNQGQPLFNVSQEAQFDVKICDPYGPSTVSEAEQSSSGIASVSYGVYAVGSLTEAKVKELVGKGDFSKFVQISEEKEPWRENPLFIGSSVDTQLSDVYETKPEEPIKIPSSVNRNDLVIIVTATDNAGNTKRAYYLFGIDRTAPEIILSYDNQAARNGKYFRAGRTATLTVRDRNFDPKLVNVKVTGNAAGLDIKDAGKVKITEWKYKQGAASGEGYYNGDDDIWEYRAEFANDGDYSIRIYGADGTENVIEDRAGNKGEVNVEGQTAPNDFVIDKAAPQVSIQMNGQADAEDGHYYYRADNCGIEVVYTDHGYNLATKGSDAGAPDYSVSIDGVEKKAYIPAGEGRANTAKVTYTAEEIAGNFDDGTHVIRVTAVDLAGNPAEAVFIKKGDKNTSRGCEFNGLTGRFILDKTAPQVTGIQTASEKGATDNQVYMDTKSVYYNSNTSVVLSVADAYVKTADFTTAIMKNGKAGEKASVKKENGGLSFTFSLSANNKYSGLTLSGKDKAGNLLVLAPGYAHNKATKVDELRDSGKGDVSAIYGKVIDDVSPVIRIRYVSGDNANLYSEEYKNRVSAYYNKDITAEYSITDNYELDGKKIRVGQANAPEGGKWAPKNPNIPSAANPASKNYNDVSYTMTAEGVYTFTGYGTDRALNPVKVREMKPRTDAKPVDSYENDVEALKGFTSKYVLILDKTSPVFTLEVSSPSSANKNLNEQGNRYYFNSGYTATATIKEANYDYRKISFVRGGVTSGGYNTETAVINQYGSRIASITKTFKDEVAADGVYRYAIYGSDKAGNALVAASRKNLDGSSAAAVDVNAEKTRGSNERQADTSNHIVIDTVAPAGQMDISNGQDTYYTMLTNGNVTFSEPYRQEQSATVLFTVDEGVERSPVRMAYSIESAVDGLSQSGDTGNYEYSRSVSVEQNGRQQFKVTSYTIEDIAGNETNAASNNFIYLDMEAPTVDTLAPAIEVVATASGDFRSAQGQPLFNSDVPVSIMVTDPYGGTSSSGLAEIQYDMYINGELVSGDTVMLHGPNTKTFNQNYEDESLDFQYSGTVTVDSGSHNYNDLRVMITAADNSGNRSTAEYSFGIDVTSPTIEVSYDNNDAQNGKYFKADRTATVVVTERNFDDSKINIQTEGAASISGWSHSSGSSDNGDDDTWTATISYTTDGEYHLSISGEDLLGNTASETQYNGVAPTDFVLDKTAPKITISFDNNDVQNGKYYKADRTATVTVDDVNFDGTNNIVVKADAENKAPGVRFDGKTCKLPFDKDGVYQITGTVTDMAGNVSEVIADPEFVLDKTMPKLMIEGVKDLSANRDPIDVVLKMLDTNVSTKGIHVDIKGTNNGDLEIGGKAKNITGGVQYTVDTINKDDYYTLVFTGTDLAGNEVVQKISFSENQHGTVFVFEQKEVEGKYTNKIFRPSFKLYNIDEVTILSVTLNGREIGYTYEDDRLELKDDLKSDGKYVITIDTKDAAGNTNSMEPVEFYVDRTIPVLTVSGIDRKQKYYFEEFDLVLIHDNPLDEFDKIELDGKVLKKQNYNIGDDGSVTLHISEYGEHKLDVTVKDAAGNTNEKEVYEFVLTRNPIIRWYSNKPLFFGSLAGMSALTVGLFIFLWNRRKKKEAEG